MNNIRKEQASYYDNFNTIASKSRINERIIGLYKRIMKFGFHPGSASLEIGCGPGKLTYLLSKKLKNGTLESTDLSENSVALARKNVSHPNISFQVSDALDLVPSRENYDNLFLFDVLEHIPLEQHSELFRRISNWMHPGSVLMINIPNPDYIRFAEKVRPESLQIIDQPLDLDMLAKHIYAAGLRIDYFETYSIWAENDYQFLIVKVQTPFQEVMLHTKRTLVQKAKARLLREYHAIRFRLPASK